MKVIYTRLIARVLMPCMLLSGACTSQAAEDLNETEFYREKIISQRIMLEDAIKQLEYEKKQVSLLKQQVELNESKVTQRPEPGSFVNDPDLIEDYERMKFQVERWKSLIRAQEIKYQKVQQELDNVVDYLNKNNIEVVKNGLGKIERIGLKIAPTAASSGVSSATYDSLMQMLGSERETSQKAIANLNRIIGSYSEEVRDWKKKFNERGVFLEDHGSNFIVSIVMDSSATDKMQIRAMLTRQVGKQQKGNLAINIDCKLPNGNLANLYTEKVSYGRHDTSIPLINIQPLRIEASGLHELIVRIENKEAYHEDVYINKKSAGK